MIILSWLEVLAAIIALMLVTRREFSGLDNIYLVAIGIVFLISAIIYFGYWGALKNQEG